LPIFVLAFPSGPWHWAQLLAQFVFASAARTDNGAALRMPMVSMMVVFIG
jgi:hypothetical protein